MLNYSTPEKLNDGRYFVKVLEPFVTTIKDVNISRSDEFFNIRLSDSSVITDIESQIIDDSVANSVQWFSKEISKDVVSNYFQSAVDENVVQVEDNLNSRGKSQVVFFNPNKESTQLDESATYLALVQLDGIWFLKKSFGPVWRLIQARVKKEVQPPSCLIKDEDSD